MQPARAPLVAHADMDAFYAAAEQLDHPELRGRPVLVGPRSGRGVVLTASYEARPFGVGSAMPMAEARRRCPNAVVVPPRFERYAELSAAVMAVFDDFSPVVEPLSMDEAFIDLSGTEHLFGAPEQAAAAIRRAVHQATGLSASVGVANSKFVAKVASGYAKPEGLCVVPAAEAVAWLGPMPVNRLWGAGPKTAERLRALGYHTIGDVARADPEVLEQRLGNLGARFHALANAQDPRPVRAARPMASMSCERTLQSDLQAPQAITAHLLRAADQLGARLRKRGCVAGGVRVKLKTSGFQTLSHQCMLGEPTDAGARLFDAAKALQERFAHPGPFRLIGMAVYDIRRAAEAQQLCLWAPAPRNAELERTLDALNERFGRGTISRARDLSPHTVLGSSPNLDFLEPTNQDRDA